MTGYWYFDLNKHKDGKYTGYYWRCSNCNGSSLVKDGFPTSEHFCHKCGAEMTDIPRISIKEINEDYLWEEL